MYLTRCFAAKNLQLYMFATLGLVWAIQAPAHTIPQVSSKPVWFPLKFFSYFT